MLKESDEESPSLLSSSSPLTFYLILIIVYLLVFTDRSAFGYINTTLNQFITSDSPLYMTRTGKGKLLLKHKMILGTSETNCRSKANTPTMTKPKKLPAKKRKTGQLKMPLKYYHSPNLQKITTLCAAFHLPVLEPGAVEQAAPPKLPPEIKQSTSSF